MSDEDRNLPPDRLWQPTTAKWFAVIFGASLAYAVIRYHFAGDVEWRHFPLFILNKATSLAAVFFVASSYLIGKIIHWHDHDPALRLVVVKYRFRGANGRTAGVARILRVDVPPGRLE